MLDLIRPFSFLTIKHPSRLPLWVNWVLPVVLTALVMVGLWLLKTPVNIFGAQGLLERVLGFVQTLAGFYIAALAAVSSFNSPHLDREMPAPAPTMYIKYNGVMQNVTATRRRFLTSMFAYLTALSIVLSLVAIAVLVLAPAITVTWPDSAAKLHWAGLFGFLSALFQMTCVTFWGLFYLGERMLTPD
ncbi:hypothetical protein AVHY2522_23570 [Acidovorax sp. SUPP2522]|uniref:hypothetical protein n=1 Tax=unclassified Acidovorax TaxID=2684926 RepID=UPI002348FBE2|nr:MULTISPECIES: hypothetical protein [unclassified Acidovorax]WCM99959.1 hypothetical protein M5C96_11475 [Acidovorax sp. GBBC 1281]GKT19738.1 hypothetical protein AVHY2522_23570 [Acidovorax sp. SUPP2522]